MGGMRGVGSRGHASHHSKGAVRAFPINGGRRGGAVFKASTPHDHGVGRGRFARPLGSARPPRVLHALGVASGAGEKPGRRWLGQRVGPDSMRLWWLDWPSGAAEPRPCSFIRRGKGRWRPALFCHLSPLASASSFHSPWRKGILVLRRWRRGSPLDSASLLLLSPRWWNRPRGEGGGGEVVGEAGAEVVVVGEEEDGAARRLRPRQ